jgi:vancomycin permeability regulator SanA
MPSQVKLATSTHYNKMKRKSEFVPNPILEGDDPARGKLWWQLGLVLARGLALFLGAFTLVNLLGNFLSPGFDANLWWIDLRFLAPPVATAIFFAAAICLVTFGLFAPCSGWPRVSTLIGLGVLTILTALNLVQFFVLVGHNGIHAGFPIPLSLFVCFGLTIALVLNLRVGSSRKFSTHPGWVLGVALAFLAIFPLAQMVCFGKTDYRRPADIAVVLGARVYADGRPSDALADRVRTACGLYRNGTARKLLFSGGPGDGSIHETESMKRMAIGLGVNAEDILLDPAGLNTQRTVENSKAIFARLRCSRVLVVSHFYHLPRIKLAYHREGLEVYTVPARESYLLRQLPYNMAREIAALWVYYLRPLSARSA